MKKKCSILVGICSAQGYVARRAAVRSTWLSHAHAGIECLFFVGGGIPFGEIDTVGLDSPDSYGALPAKVLAFFRYALENYDFDWLFKCDDDTYLDLSRLSELADSRYGIVGDVLLAQRNAPSGGAGYLLSREIVERIAAHGQVPVSGAEDLIFGRLALEVGAIPHSTGRLYLSHGHYPAPENDIVSAHWCNPEIMHALEVLRHGHPETCYKGKHEHWEDEILFYREGIFRRRRTSCYGWWTLGEDDVLTLRWKMWKPENLLWSEGVFTGSSVRLARMEGLPSLWELLPPPWLAADNPGEVVSSPVVEYIHAGCGDRALEGWLNVDLPHFDITKPLPWKTESVKALFLEHVVEYLTPQELGNFLKEARRLLVPSGILRLAVMDVGVFASRVPVSWRQYVRTKTQEPVLSGDELDTLLQHGGHRSFWTEGSLSAFLELAGFSVNLCRQGESSVSMLCGLERREPRPEYPFELLGTICLEAVKREYAYLSHGSAGTFEEESVFAGRPPALLTQGAKRGNWVAPCFLRGSRTGNRLFQIAAVYAHALRHGLECRVPWRFEPLMSRLYDMLGAEAGCCPNGGYEGSVTYKEKQFAYAPIPASVLCGRISGYFQSEKYFADYGDEVRKLYSGLVLPRWEGSAGIHIRRGDYLKLAHKFRTPDVEFLEESFRQLSDNVRTMHIFSDAPSEALELVKEVPGIAKWELVLNEEDTLPALRTMSRMQELVMSCSSFSWWAAWLGDIEKVMVQKKWFTGSIRRYEDVYREKWIRL